MRNNHITDHRNLRRENSSLKNGFSLIELMIVITIIATIALGASGSYRNFGKGVEINSTARGIASDLRHMQSNAMAGVDGMKWGIHFVNDTTDYYESFSTPTTYADGARIVTATTTLGIGTDFSEPLSFTTKDIIFSKITGTTIESSISVTSEGKNETVNVTSIGTVY